MSKFSLFFVLLASVAFSQSDPASEDARGELHFRNAGIAVRLVGKDSILVTVGALSEDLQNTVGVFPYEDEFSVAPDTANFRLFERKLEVYLQERIPVTVDGKRVYLRVVSWKPGGKGREDRLDMPSLYVKNLFITLGGRLPKQGKNLDITTNIWAERTDAADTEIQLSLFQDRTALRRLWTRREQTIRFPISSDSLKAMRKNPPPRLYIPTEEEEDEDDHSGHVH